MANNGAIDLGGEAELIISPEKRKTITTLTVQRVVAIPPKRIIRAFILEIGTPITLYEGDEYDALNGVISMEDIETKVKEILGLGSSSSA